MFTLWQKVFVWSRHDGWAWNGNWEAVATYRTRYGAMMARSACCGNDSSYRIVGPGGEVPSHASSHEELTALVNAYLAACPGEFVGPGAVVA